MNVDPLSILVVAVGADVETLPEELPEVAVVAVLRVVDALPVTVAVLDAGTEAGTVPDMAEMPEIPDAVALAVPARTAGEAQSHTRRRNFSISHGSSVS